MSILPATPDAARIALAFSWVADWHSAQYRKSTTIPYLSHLMSVSALVMEYGGDEDQTIAALFHDALEDAPGAAEAAERRARIESQFGSKVVRIVDCCTDGTPDSEGRKPAWRERKEAYLAHLARTPTDALLVSAADKLHNARSIVSDLRVGGGEVFSRFSAGKEGTLWYYGQLASTFGRHLPGALASELQRTVDEMASLSDAAP